MLVDTTVWTTFLNQLPAIIASAATLIGVLIASRKITKGQTDAANQVVVDKEKNDKRLDSIHGLVNSVHGTSLRLAATLAERLAEITNTKGDRDVAEATKKAADEHDLKQLREDQKQ
jgi:hypothetical protein